MNIITESLKNKINIKGFNNLLISLVDFKIKEIIGEGATSVVYKAKYIRNNIYYALKAIPKISQDPILTT